MPLRYRLGIDLGTTSIGWAMLRLTDDERPRPKAVIRGGVRIFNTGRDPQTEASLAVARRNARAMRRNRDRRLKRKQRLLSALVTSGLLPTDVESRKELVDLDPYDLRKRALDERLEPEELGRAIWHLGQRRGFKSNRKTDAGDDESSLMKDAIAQVRASIAADNCRTLGEWLAFRRQTGLPVRARLLGQSASEKHYELYFDRALVLAEFDTIWDAQSEHHPQLLTDEARAEVHEAIFYQRSLRPVDPGRCTLDPTQKRAPLALPSVQRLRILQEVNNLRLQAADLGLTQLDLAQRDAIVERLTRQQRMTFNAIRKLLGLPREAVFNLEGPKRDHLKGDLVACEMANEKRFGPSWHEMPLEEQDAVIEQLLDAEDDAKLVAWLQETHGLEDSQAVEVARARLPQGYSRLGRDSSRRILLPLQESVTSYAAAVQEAGFDTHSDLGFTARTGELLNELPYYGQVLERFVSFGTNNPEDAPETRYGRIANPTVHIGLNELRKVVNEIVQQYGPPDQIVVEVARELKQSAKKRREIESQQAERQQHNDWIRSQIKPLLGREPSRDDVLRYRLWEELSPNPAARCCPYTGQPISLNQLFSSAVEIEHILPFAQTLDDSLNNKTVAFAKANREKGNRSPFDAFGHSPLNYDYDAMLMRVADMPSGKRYRFGPDGMQRWLRDDSDFLARSLNDTSYLARIARQYLSVITDPNDVWVIPGRLTGKLRFLMGLDSILSDAHSKNRFDHRHHAVDAAVVGITDRAMLKAFADANSKPESHKIEGVTEPWPGFRQHVERMVSSIHVSHRPQHGYQTQFANETAYGLRADGTVVTRKPLTALDTSAKLAKAEFVDAVLKKRITAATTGDETGYKKRLQQFSEETGVRRVRLVERLSVIPISVRDAESDRLPRATRSTDGRTYKGLKGDSNYCIEIVADDKGRWTGEVISSFRAYQIVSTHGMHRLRDPNRSQSGKPLIMRLMRDDLIRLEVDNVVQTMRVCTMRSSGAVFLAESTESNVDARNRDKGDPFKYLQKTPRSLQNMKTRMVTVTPSGRLHDPGPIR